MEVIELVKSFSGTLKLMSKSGIRVSDFSHINLFDEYVSMRKAGYKVSYIEAVLSERYKISTRSISRIVSRFKRHVIF